jgi:hypothetical protein
VVCDTPYLKKMLRLAAEERLARARSWATQFRVLFRRALRAQLRNPTDVTARLLLSCWVGMVAGAPPRPRAACRHSACRRTLARSSRA